LKQSRHLRSFHIRYEVALFKEPRVGRAQGMRHSHPSIRVPPVCKLKLRLCVVQAPCKVLSLGSSTSASTPEDGGAPCNPEFSVPIIQKLLPTLQGLASSWCGKWRGKDES
jgi:hypothetical protein